MAVKSVLRTERDKKEKLVETDNLVLLYRQPWHGTRAHYPIRSTTTHRCPYCSAISGFPRVFTTARHCRYVCAKIDERFPVNAYHRNRQRESYDCHGVGMYTRPINDYLYFAKISMAPLNCIFNVYINCLQHKYTEIPLSIFFNPLVPRRFCTLETVVISFIFIHIAFPLKKYSNSIWIFTKFKILQALSLVGIRFFGYYNMYGYQIDKADSVCPET